MKKLNFILIVVFTVICLAQLGFGQDTGRYVTFKIPVELHNMHQDIKEIYIGCNCQYSGEEFGEGHKSVTMPPDGELVTEVEVICREIEGKDITKATIYMCNLRLVTNQNPFPAEPSTSSDAPAAIQIKPGTEAQIVIRGDIHW